MAILGVLARVDSQQRDAVLEALGQLGGVATFSVADEQRVGILIESDTVDATHALLTGVVNQVPGVLGTWPVFSHTGRDAADELMTAGEPSAS